MIYMVPLSVTLNDPLTQN